VRISPPINAGLGSYRLTAGTGGRQVGSVMVHARDKGVVEVTDLGVDPAHREHGIGKMLLASAVRTGLQLGKSKVVLAAQDNGSGRLTQWYKGMGFTQVGRNERGFPRLEASIGGVVSRTAQRSVAVACAPNLRAAFLQFSPKGQVSRTSAAFARYPVIFRNSVAQKMDVEVDFGRSGYSRPDFPQGVANIVTDDVNEQMGNWGLPDVDRKDFHLAHKVPFEAIRNKIMSYIYKKGSTTAVELVAKTDALYTVDKTRYPHMVQKRAELLKLINHYGYIEKGPMLITDAANALLFELNGAPDNLGLGIPKENTSIGGWPDPVIVAWNASSSTVTFSPRSDAIDDEWNLVGRLKYDKFGNPRSSQVTSFFNH
jgi:hypothetical protein